MVPDGEVTVGWGQRRIICSMSHFSGHNVGRRSPDCTQGASRRNMRKVRGEWGCPDDLRAGRMVRDFSRFYSHFLDVGLRYATRELV